MSARAKGWIYVALFLLALGAAVAVFLVTTSADTWPFALLAVAGLITLVGAIYACIEAVRIVRKAFTPSSQKEPEMLAPERASFSPEYAARFGQRPSHESEQPQRRPAAGGQEGIETDER